jgi:hypothetical protein
MGVGFRTEDQLVKPMGANHGRVYKGCERIINSALDQVIELALHTQFTDRN